MKKTLILACALALAGVSTSAMAAGKAFVGGEIGTTDVKVVGSGGSDNDTSFTVRGGYYFLKNLGVEASYNSLYDQDDAKLTSYGVGAVAKTDFENTGVFFTGRFGFERVKGEVGTFEDSKNEPYLGVGVGYDLNDSFGLSLNYTLHKADFSGVEVNSDTISLGGEYRF